MFLAILALPWEWEGSGKEGKQAELWKRSRWLIYTTIEEPLVFFGEQKGNIAVEMLLHT